MKRLVIIIFDAAGIASALIIAAAVRFDANIPPEELKLIMLSMPAVIIGKLVALMLFHCDQWSFKYAGSMELRRLLAALSLGSLLGWAFTYLVGPDGTSRAVLLLEPLFSLFLLGAFRFGLRLLPDRIPAIAEDQPGARKVIIIGAGDAGVITLKEIRRHPNSDMVVVGFIDDDPKKHGLWIDGVRVIGGRNEISSAVKSLSVDELIIAIPSAGGETIRELIDACREVKTRFRVVPGLLSIIKGTVTFSRIREIKPEDLLGRETTEIEPELFRKDFDGKKVLVTGAGGSIGSELCRQLNYSGAELILLDHSESAIYSIDSELRSKGHGKIISFIADLRTQERIEEIISTEKPDYVFHAAAFKHVPLMEENIFEAVTTNIIGTKNLAESSFRHGVKRFTFISTDKAVRPTSVMGATKRAAEMWLFSNDWERVENKMSVSAVRFGNVLGSSGSVVPLFRKQIESGGPVTVTHPNVVRFFMTIPEAVFLVIHASLLGDLHDLFVLEMGQPIRILDLAKNMITLAGLRPETDIPLRFTGLRPGEKLYEEVLTDGEDVSPTEIKKVFRIGRHNEISNDFPKMFDELIANARPGRNEVLKELICRIVPDFHPDLMRRE
ncbi:MAG: hypothetical protein COS94_02955 [Candidatus Hydrogenedentes bacterium CG07_land_8_20_14_0_80_42_17]|nr:MAG: hypothetical protein COS94_02955 [Candidatus Hydrogenedentes bacterium CG07_land_8_20_14_0_80_42_17]